jgi:WD40 repeat protein/serine/threonine protein kinase/tetratricopeptide (TPR) repeat protein
MRPEISPDEALVHRLPLPLAQLYRRAHNAKTALERHLTAFYLWEAALKLLAAAAVVAYAEGGPADPAVAAKVRNLARPALGHWWELARLLVPALADRGDDAFRRARDFLLGKARDDCPRAAGLDALLREELEGKPGARTTVQIGQLFDRLVNLRNEEVGHGAAGQRPEEYYERMGPALLAGVAEVLNRLDVLTGRRLVHVADVRRLASGRWLVERYELHGEAPRRLESLEVPEADAARLPRPGRLYLSPPDGSDFRRGLHPLVVYAPEVAQTFFLNARRGEVRADYLCYTTGEVVRRDELGAEQRELLAKVLGGPVEPSAVESWAARSKAEEQPPLCPAPGRPTIGEFELISRLGQGGMGVVYRAWQPSLGRQVALKCLLRAGDAKAEARFALEIHALGRVEHPHLVKVFTSGAEGKDWFYAMELVEGADLAAVCARLASRTAAELGEDDWTAAVSTACEEQRKLEQPLSDDRRKEDAPGPHVTAAPTAADRPAGRGHVAQVVELVRQAAEAVHALHEAGVIHRDIKPGNVMVTADGRHAVLMDLGLARLQDEAQGRLPQTQGFVGTLRYASPEQLGGATLDRRADVYSLGATLWELLTFRPFLGVTDQTPTPDAILKVQQAEPERVRRHNPRVPADLEAVVARCVEKDRSRRYATAADLAADLGRWQRGEPVQAQPPSLSYLLRKRAWRYRVPLTAAALVLLAAAVGVVASFLEITAALNKETQANANAVREKEEADRLRKVAEGRGEELEAALGREQKALADLKAQFPVVAQGFAAAGDAEFRKGNAPESLAWTLRAYETAPADDPRRRSYLNLLLAQSRSLARPVCPPLIHVGDVEAVAYSPDDRHVLTACADKAARLWDAATGRLLRTLPHEGIVWVAAFSPDGRRVLTGSGADGKARVWDADTGQLLATLDHDGPVRAVAFSPDGRRVLTGSADKSARLWDAAGGPPLLTLPHKGIVWAVAFSPDGRTLLTGSADKRGRLWDAVTGKELFALPHDDTVWAVAFSPDGHSVLTGSKDHYARVWETATGKMKKEFRHEDSVYAVAFSPDGRNLLTASSDKTAYLWDADKLTRRYTLHHDGMVWAAQFSPDGRFVLTGSADKSGRLWDVRTGKLLARLPHTTGIWSLAFSPDGRAAVTSTLDNSAWLWDLTRDRLREVVAGETTVYSAAFSPDGKSLLTGGEAPTARLWEVATGNLLASFRHDGAVWAVAFSPDGRTVLTGCEDNSVRLWDVSSGKQLLLLHHDGPVEGVAFSPDGRTLLTGSHDKTARLWEADGGKLLRTLSHGDQVHGVAFSPDGRSVLTACQDDQARLWDAATGKVRLAVRHDSSVWGVAFSPDGRTFLSAGWDNAARLWETETGKPLAAYHNNRMVTVVAFSPDGRTALTAGRDSTARLWDVPTGQQLAELPHPSRVRAAAFHPDGHSALTYSDEGAAWRWEIFPAPPEDPAPLPAWVRVRAQRGFDENTLRPLSRDELLLAWADLAEKGGDGEGPPDARTWHLARAGLAEQERDWFAAVFHLSRLPEPARDSADALRRRGYARAALGQWDGAVADLRRAVQLNPDDAAAWEWLGAAYLGAGDVTAYRDHCRRAVDRFAKTTDAATANRVARLAALVPDTVSDPQALVQLALRATAVDPANWEYLTTLGAALYRAGRYADAVNFLNKADKKSPWGVAVAMKAFLALATQRLGEQLTLPSAAGALASGQTFGPLAALQSTVSGSDAARESLKRAELYLFMEVETHTFPAVSWPEDVQRRCPLQEAKALLKPAGK